MAALPATGPNIGALWRTAQSIIIVSGQARYSIVTSIITRLFRVIARQVAVCLASALSFLSLLKREQRQVVANTFAPSEELARNQLQGHKGVQITSLHESINVIAKRNKAKAPVIASNL